MARIIHMAITESKQFKQENEDIIWLWVLRIYARKLVKMEDNENPRHLLPALKTYAIDEHDEKAKDAPYDFHEIIEKQLAVYECKRPKLTDSLGENIQRLRRKFGLSVVQCEILALPMLYSIFSTLEDTVDSVCHRWSDDYLYKTLAAALKRSMPEIKQALASEGQLCSSGLLTLNRTAQHAFDEKLHSYPGLAEALGKRHESTDSLLGFMLKKTSAPSVSSRDFPHHDSVIKIIKQHIANASTAQMKGVNILLHGIPGVGKTELASAIASELKLHAYEVATEKEAEFSRSGAIHFRFRNFMMLQRLLKTTKALIIFDEIEEVLPEAGPFFRSTDNKAWINQLLENNPVPAIWISNQVSHIDPAFMRRFDIVLEVRTLPRSMRRQLLQQAFHGLQVDEHWLEQKASETDLTPAITRKTVNVLRNARAKSSETIEVHFDSLMQERRNASGITINQAYPVMQNYRLDLLNTDMKMQLLADGLGKNQRGKILLYGPPGTGKTAFAHYLAKRLDRPLILKRASDLMSKWLGGTEKNFSAMFREAGQDNAILLLDEADSFLQDRRSATHPWELTQVNELLTQMESFHGIFICATNFMQHLDAAAMRRFTCKVKFDYLNSRQVEELIFDTLKNLGNKYISDIEQQAIHKKSLVLTNLAAGDFAVVSDQFKLLDQKPCVQELLSELSVSSVIKGDSSLRKIGFAA